MAQVGDAERTEIRQLYEVGTQVHVLEQMYPPEVVKVVVDEVENERIMADQLKEIERQNEMIEEENKRTSMAVPTADEANEEDENTNNNNGDDAEAAQEKAMENLLKAAEEADAAKKAAEAKMAAEREAARLEEENAAAAAAAAAKKRLAEEAAAEEAARLEEENRAREKREAEQKVALEKLAQEKEAQERFMQKQKELEEERAKAAEEEERIRIEEAEKKQKELEAAEEAKRKAEEEERIRIEEAEKKQKELEAAEETRRKAVEEQRIKAEKEAAEKARLEEEERVRKAEEERFEKEAERKSGKAERRLTEERLDDEVERLALEMQAELDKFGDDDGNKLDNGDSKAIDDVADQLARDMQRELDKLTSTSKGDDDDIEKIDDVADQLAKEMQIEMDKLGLDDSKKFDVVDSSSAVQEGKELIDDVKALLGKGPEEEEEEMEIDFLADLNDDSAPPKGNNNLAPTSSIRNLVGGKVSQITGSIEKKTKIKPFIKPDEGPMSSKQVSPSVRSKEVRVVPFVCPKSKAQKSADMKNPKTRPADSPGKLDPKLREQQVIGIAAPAAPLPRVAKLSPTRIKARELKPTTPRSKSPRPTPGRLKHGWSPIKSPNTPPSPPVALPRVATLASPVRPKFDSPQESLPPKITSPPIIPPRSNTQMKHTLPRVLSPRDAPMCPTPYDPELHGSKGPCERCMELASEEEKEKFAITGHHLRIMIVSGGCGKGCLVFPRSEDDIPVRLCKKCYFDTHRTYYDALECQPPPVDR